MPSEKLIAKKENGKECILDGKSCEEVERSW